MAMQTGHFDAAGDNAAPDAVTVGGYMSPVRNWSRFRRDWRKVLDPIGIGEFHMTDFIAGEGDFKAWKTSVCLSMATEAKGTWRFLWITSGDALQNWLEYFPSPNLRAWSLCRRATWPHGSRDT
jgi:hypothetical protein